MKKTIASMIGVLAILLALGLTSCASPVNASRPQSPTSTVGTAPVGPTYSDPFAYCTAVGTIDAPDARYTGPQVPDVVINGYLKASGLQGSTEPIDILQKTTSWRCMENSVYACNIGANLPCNSKANIDKTPTQAMADYCSANPDSDFIPASVTGTSTIYSWHCVKDTAELLDQVDQVDAAGFLARIWYQITPNP